jgi:hypothetical protein
VSLGVTPNPVRISTGRSTYGFRVGIDARRVPSLGGGFDLSFFKKAGDAETARPELEVRLIEHGVRGDETADVAPLTIRIFAAIAVPAQFRE